jgi:hypothetical protein
MDFLFCFLVLFLHMIFFLVLWINPRPSRMQSTHFTTKPLHVMF